MAGESGFRNEEGWKAIYEGVKARTCIVAGILDDSERVCRETASATRKAIRVVRLSKWRAGTMHETCKALEFLLLASKLG